MHTSSCILGKTQGLENQRRELTRFSETSQMQVVERGHGRDPGFGVPCWPT